jgi:Na+-translocating ferredoxin:NAD+ oxidoreductase RnfD subunit
MICRYQDAFGGHGQFSENPSKMGAARYQISFPGTSLPLGLAECRKSAGMPQNWVIAPGAQQMLK